MCSVFTVVQFISSAELVSVTTVCTIMSAVKCKLCNVCLWGHVLAQLVEALHYKLEVYWFNPRGYHWNFMLT